MNAVEKSKADLFDSESDVRSRVYYQRLFDTVRAFVNTGVAVDNAASDATIAVTATAATATAATATTVAAFAFSGHWP